MNLEAIAQEVKRARDRRLPLVPFAERVAGFDVPAAYEVANLVYEARLRAGEKPLGRKIGFSNRDLWPLFGIDAPVWGYVYDSTVRFLARPEATFALGSLFEPRIEPEIVIKLRSAPQASADTAELLTSIEWLALGFEIVECPYPGWKFQAADTIAACALHAALLIGKPRRIEDLPGDLAQSLASFTLSLACDGAVREQGGGAKVLDSPLAALGHLVAVLAGQTRARPLGAGDLVTTGTLTGAPRVHPGETWSTAIRGLDLGDLTLTFER